MDSTSQRSKKKRQLKRKKEGFDKSKHQHSASTPSSSVTLPSAINQSLVNANKWLARGRNVEIDLSQLRFKSITGVQDAFFSKYKEIHFLNLSNNFLSTLPECFQLDCVRSLSVHANQLKTISLVKSMGSLIELNLSSNNLTEFLDERTIALMPSIKKLFMQNNQIATVPAESLKALSTRRIEVLNLSFNRIAYLPQEIGLLMTLIALNLSDNELVELPTSILLLPLLYEPSTRFEVYRNKLIKPPQQIADRNGLKSIKEHLQPAANKAKIADIQTIATFLRMVVVGHEGAGKSELVKKLGTANITAQNVQSDAALTFREQQDAKNEMQPDAHIPHTLLLGSAVRDSFLSRLPAEDRVPFPLDIKLNIYDFVGQEIYHAISEMFFSHSSLHLVVFNVAHINSTHDCDVYVQYWIDLIQARAPGSSIVIAATHADLLSPGEAQNRLKMVQARIAGNEALRLADLRNDIKFGDSNDNSVLKALLRQRPKVYPNIVAYSEGDTTFRGLKELIGQISMLVSPSKSTPHPFGYISVDLLPHYLLVRVMFNHMRRTYQRHYCTIRELHEKVCDWYHSMGQPDYGVADPQGEFENTKNAIVHWAAVGEIIWFCAEDDDSQLMSKDLSHSGEEGVFWNSPHHSRLPSAEMAAAPILQEEGWTAATSGDDTTSQGVVKALQSSYDRIDRSSLTSDTGRSTERSGAGSDGDEDSEGGDENNVFNEVNSIGEYEDADNTYEDERGSYTSHTESQTRGDTTTVSGDLDQSVDDITRDAAGHIDLSEYLFLSPTWLNNAIAGVMNKEAMGEVEQKMSQLAAQDHNAAAHNETMRCNFCNGVVYWDMIKSFLLYKSDVLKLPRSGNRAVAGESLDRTLEVLRAVLICLTVIIPIENTNPAGDNQSAHSATSTGTAAANTTAPDFPDCVSVSSAVTSEVEDQPRLSTLSVDRNSLAHELELAGITINHTGPRECYLLPALLAEPNADGNDALSGTNAANQKSSVMSHVSFAQKGSVRLERRFSFSRFVPSALVPRIIAKMYSRFGELLKTTSPLENRDRSKCWRSTFIQEYGDCTVWILFEEGLSRLEQHNTKGSPMNLSPRSRRGSEDFTEPDFFAGAIDRIAAIGISNYEMQGRDEAFESAEWDTFDADFITDSVSACSFVQPLNDEADFPEPGCDEETPPTPKDANLADTLTEVAESEDQEDPLGRVLQLRIISFGHLLHVQSIVASLDDYSDAVQEILDEYRGVSTIYPTTLCPVCLLRQLPEELCGQISKTEVDLLASSINALGDVQDVSNEDRLSAYTSLRLSCATGKCIIKPDFLVQVPEEITKLISAQQHYDFLTEYIRQEIINTSLSPPNRINRLTVENVEQFTVNVLPVFPSDAQYAQLGNYFAGRVPLASLPYFNCPNGKIRSGSYVSVPLEGAGTLSSPNAAGFVSASATSVSGKSASSVKNVVLSAFPFNKSTDRSSYQQYFLVGDNKDWLYFAKYINQPLPRNLAQRPHKELSDACLLELLAPVTRTPISPDVTDIVHFSLCKEDHRVLRSYDNSVDNALPGRKFTPKPLYLPSLHRTSEGNKVDNRYLQVEQVVQMCGYGAHTKAVDSNWARVVQRRGEYYLVSVYAEQHLIGGPVLDNTGRLVGVVSAHLYRKGNVSAFYLASLNDIESV